VSDLSNVQEIKLDKQRFCARGKAKEKVKDAGCLCPNCAVFRKFALDQMYYFIKGKSVDIKA
jgi:hypothetical protein